MKQFYILLIVFSLIFINNNGMAGDPVSHPYQYTHGYAKGEVLIKYRMNVSQNVIEHLHARLSLKNMKTFKNAQIRHLKLPDQMSIKEAIDTLSKDPNVEFVEPNFIRHMNSTIPTDPNFGDQWGLNNIGQTVNGTSGKADADIDAPEAWDITKGDKSIIVAVIDSGVDYGHPDLSSNVLSGWDFLDNDNDPMDANGHGTHIAGIIGAVGNNATGVSGVCWIVEILPLRVMNANGDAYVSDVISAVDYAIQHGAKIINQSMTGSDFSQAEYDVISSANTSGILFIAAAGNNAGDNDIYPVYPASYALPNIIAVAASDQDDNLDSSSNYGSASVHVAAPGANILSTVPVRMVVWSDDFDDGNIDNWTKGGTNNTFGLSVVSFFSPPYALSTSPSGLYNNNTDAWIQAPILDLSSYHGLTLEFLFKGIAEYNRDFLYVETSTDGVNWTIQDTITGNYSTGWYPQVVDLGAYDGQGSVYLRFRFDTDAAGVADGFFIDNVTIKAVSSTYTGSEYDYKSGTSMAAAYVSGIAALVWSHHPSWSYLNIKNAILNGSDIKDSLRGKVSTNGRINAYNAVTAVQQPSAPSSTTGSEDSGGGNCFIATAAYGSYLHPYVRVLRDFRNEHLLTNPVGRAFVRWYYKNSPPVAVFIAHHDSVRTGVRWVLTPVVYVIIHLQLFCMMIIAMGLMIVVRKRKKCG